MLELAELVSGSPARSSPPFRVAQNRAVQPAWHLAFTLAPVSTNIQTVVRCFPGPPPENAQASDSGAWPLQSVVWTSAPPSIIALAVSKWPICATHASAVRPEASGSSVSAPHETRSLATSASSRSAAMIRRFLPLDASRATGAPTSRRALTSSASPSLVASVNALCPCSAVQESRVSFLARDYEGRLSGVVLRIDGSPLLEKEAGDVEIRAEVCDDPQRACGDFELNSIVEWARHVARLPAESFLIMVVERSDDELCSLPASVAASGLDHRVVLLGKNACLCQGVTVAPRSHSNLATS
ncbi:hypothetical protein CSOJ01_12726 [Colletotrichum sojae]|uniref:Uncharacterized protein n=1 Tax=Colletotrichum sojae TaxID=2175907 RepID=A0A8H6IUV5_9PEZI|nr:hypothetical protein CSOJ01_12726 [Colletotrichum sojae]